MFCTDFKLNLDRKIYGNKAANLSTCIYKAQVPKGIVTSNMFYKVLLKPIRKDINRILMGCNFDNLDDIAERSRLIHNGISSLKMPKEVWDDIRKAVLSLGPVIAVRSSSSVEDSRGFSYAGVFDSVINVPNKTQIENGTIWNSSEIEQAIKKVIASNYGIRALSYHYNRHRDRKKDFTQEHFIDSIGDMSILIQTMIDADYSGILFTKHPEKTKGSHIISTKGSLDKLVGGKISADQDSDYSDFSVSELYNMGQALEKHFDGPLDIEWAIKGKITYLLQVRHITTDPVHVLQTKKYNRGKPILQGVGIPPRYIPYMQTNQIYKPKDFSDFKNFPSGCILVAKDTSPDWEPMLLKAKGLITNKGSRTSHAAIFCRENNIPAIVGCDNATEILKNDEFVDMVFNEADWGLVYKKDKENG